MLIRGSIRAHPSSTLAISIRLKDQAQQIVSTHRVLKYEEALETCANNKHSLSQTRRHSSCSAIVNAPRIHNTQPQTSANLQHVLVHLHPILLRLRLLHDLGQRRVLQQSDLLGLLCRRLVKRYVREAGCKFRRHQQILLQRLQRRSHTGIPTRRITVPCATKAC